MDWTSLNSSNLRGANYNAETKDLNVKFKSGAIYEYADVPEAVYKELIDVDKPTGGFFHTNIRDTFKFKKLN